jgi:hypothetical protein
MAFFAELSIHILLIILGAYVPLIVLIICRAGRLKGENKSMAERRIIFFFVLRVTLSCFTIYLGHAIGSEGTAIMTTTSSSCACVASSTPSYWDFWELR